MDRKEREDLRDDLLAELWKSLKASEQADASDPTQLPPKQRPMPTDPEATVECPSCGYAGPMDSFGY